MLEKDILTGLYMRPAMEKRMDELLDNKRAGTLVIADIRNFDKVNKTYGRLMGDRLLKAFTTVLQCMEDPADILSRIGPDTFALFYLDGRSLEQSGQLKKNIERGIGRAGKEAGIKEEVEVVVVAASGGAGDNSSGMFARAYLLLTSEKRKAKGSMPYNKEEREKLDRDCVYTRDMMIISSELSEKGDVKGAYLQNYETFKSTYQFIARGMERSGGTASIILLTLDGEEVLPEKKEELMEILYRVIRTELRRGDAFTQYSSCQYLLMVIGAEQEDARKIGRRVKNKFEQVAAHEYELMLCYDTCPMTAPVTDKG